MYFNDFLMKNRARYDVLLCDIDGTLAHGSRAAAGAVELLDFCHKNDLPVFLLTNDSNHSLEEKSAIIEQAGLIVTTEEIISAGSMLKYFVEENHIAGQKFFVLGDLGKPCFAEHAGLEVCRNPDQIEDCAGIIIGEGKYNWQGFLHVAFNFFIRHPDRWLLSPNPDSYWPSHVRGEFGIGAGGKARFLRMLLHEYGLEVEPHFLGKPYPGIYRCALEETQRRWNLKEPLSPARALMLGDSLTSDIAGAKAIGITSALLMTGITTPEKLATAPETLQPDLTFEGLAQV